LICQWNICNNSFVNDYIEFTMLTIKAITQYIEAFKMAIVANRKPKFEVGQIVFYKGRETKVTNREIKETLQRTIVWEDNINCYVYQGNTNGKDDKDFGEHTVQEWSIKNWGTKWDAMNTRIDTNNPNTMYFETAWNPPYPVIIALANKFKVDFLLEWFDENLNASSELWKLQVGGELDGIMIRDKQHNFKKVEGVAWQEFDDLIRSHGFYRKLSQYLQNSDVFQEI